MEKRRIGKLVVSIFGRALFTVFLASKSDAHEFKVATADELELRKLPAYGMSICLFLSLLLLFISNCYSENTGKSNLQNKKDQRDVTAFNLRANLGFAEFSMNKIGALRLYGCMGKRPLIGSIALEEGGKHQYKDSLRRKTSWTQGKLWLVKGKTGHVIPQGWRRARPVQFLSPEDNFIELKATGRLINQWEEVVTVERKGLAGNILHVGFSRKEKKGDHPFSLFINFLRWTEEDVRGFVKRSSGESEDLKEGKTGISSEDKIILSSWQTGDEIILSVDRECKVEKKRIIPQGGWYIRFIPCSYKEGEIRLRVEHRRFSKINIGGLDLIINNKNGTVQLDCGNLPLLSLEAFEDGVYQSETGYGIQHRWDITSEYAKEKFILRGKGKIRSSLQISLKGKNNSLEIEYFWKERIRENRGLRIFIPYRLVGAPVKLILPGGIEVKEVDGIPLRVGIDLELGSYPKGTILIFNPTATEEVGIELKNNFKIVSSRRKPLKGVIFVHPAAELIFIPQNRKCKIQLWYRRTFPKEEKIEVARLDFPEIKTPIQKIVDFPQKGDIAVITPWWRVIHCKKKGGSISHISFPYGSNKNIIIAPVDSYIVVNGLKYSVSEDISPEIRIREIDEKEIVIQTKGTLRSKKGVLEKKHPINYEITYQYKPHCMKRIVSFDFGEGIKGIEKIVVCQVDLNPYLDYVGCKPCVHEWRKAVFPGPNVFSSRVGIIGISVFKKGREGIEVIPTKEVELWKKQLPVKTDESRFMVTGNRAGGASIIMAAYDCPLKPITCQGKKSFTHFLNLPLVRKYLPKRWFVVVGDQRIWINEETVPKFADSGVNLILAGCGGGWASYNMAYVSAKTREESSHIVKLVHKYKIKVVPFFGFYLLSCGTDAFKKYGKEWAESRKIDERGEVVVNTGFGNKAFMCFEAEGYRQYLKENIPEVLDYFNYDGVYYDFMYPLNICKNPNHSKGLHSGIEGQLDMAEWSHDLAKKRDGVFFAHTGYHPTILLENLLSLAWVGEEIEFWYRREGVEPALERLSEYEFVNNTTRVIDNAISVGKGQWYEEDVKTFMSRLVLCGIFPLAHCAQAKAKDSSDVLTKLKHHLYLFACFKSVDLSKFHFRNWESQQAVITDNPYIRAATYWNDKEALIVLSNSESYLTQEFTFKVNPSAFGWKKATSYKLISQPEGKIFKVSKDELLRFGLKGKLGGHEYIVYLLKAVQTE